MRTLLFALSALTLVATAVAQNPESRQLRNNNPYLVRSTGTHATTGLNYNWPPMNHPGYSNGIGVPAGAHVWRVNAQQTGHRGEAHDLAGYTMILRTSAASNAVGPNAYEPDMKLLGCLPRAGGGLDPDFTTVHHTIAEAAAPVTSQTFRVTTTFAATPVTLTDYALAMMYHGGEEQDVPDVATGTQPSQGMCGSWKDGPVYDKATGTSYASTGFEDAGVITYGSDVNFISWMGLLVTQPSLSQFSDWGQQRIAVLPTPLLGHSIATYSSDLGTAPTSSFGYSVRSDSSIFANGTALLFLNVGGFIPITGLNFPTPFGMVNLAVDITSPVANTLTALLLGANGEVDGISMPIPGPQAGLVGLDWGVQAVLIDSGFSAIDSSEAAWMNIR